MDKKDENLVEKVNKLSLPVTILIASVILGGFYYMSEANKQASIEKQQQVELQAKKAEQQALIDQNNNIANQKAVCSTEAEQEAQDQYKLTCTYGCHAGYRYNADYDNYYNTCLQRMGLK